MYIDLNYTEKMVQDSQEPNAYRLSIDTESQLQATFVFLASLAKETIEMIEAVPDPRTDTGLPSIRWALQYIINTYPEHESEDSQSIMFWKITQSILNLLKEQIPDSLGGTRYKKELYPEIEKRLAIDLMGLTPQEFGAHMMYEVKLARY